MTKNKISLSVVVPVYSGSEYLSKLLEELEVLRMQWNDSDAVLTMSEVVFVDDGSIDNSSKILDELVIKNSWISVIHLARNFGQHAATIAGILHTSGDWVVTLDEDLQHPPKNIPLLLQKVTECHCDIVYANSENGVHEKGIRDISSRIYKSIMKVITRNPYIQNVSSFRLIRGGVARGASSVCGHDTYFDVALSWFSNRIAAVPMPLKDDRYITTGRSGYSIGSLMSHARRMLFSSNLKILRFAAFVGFILVAMSAVLGTALLITKFLNPEIIPTQGWTSLMLVIVLFGGLSMMFIGIILEYLSLLVQRAHGRPLFFVIDRSSDTDLIGHFAQQVK